MRLACIVGARPNFMKMAPILKAFEAYQGVETVLVHTGQHYDKNLSDIFFEELDMRRPDITLEVGSGKHGQQTARVIERFEEVLENAADEGKPFDRVLVVGDVNSTMATTIAAVKLGVPVAHVEAGLRSFDRTMPEEINRILTDAIADMLLVSDPAGMDNLRNEGHGEDEMMLVGNVMIDTLKRLLPRAQARDTLARHGLTAGSYGLVTLHRPANVDTAESLGPLLDVLVETSKSLPLVFPIHPRTKQRIERFGFDEKLDSAEGLLQLGPAGYLDFLALSSQSKVTVTDSGGLQEESTVLGIPCLTARPNTERPITVTEGTSTLVGNNADLLRSGLRAVLDGTYKTGKCPELWDGHAAERIAKVVVERAGK
ncbi:MAG: UDP-N-acetylglucosamine 2-epimerase (non-hydrolyzing) [Planctomycetota bacterium]|nr:UDP-N-acetylglucosamine 2-epimerase (non-hydrolyzing) [Planctomycetota bacterium]